MTTGQAPADADRVLDEPYVGLTYYDEDHADLFFGRDAESAVIVGNLRASRLTLLYAESGVGKSSLLHAGVAAHIRRQAERTKREGRGRLLVPVVFSSWTEDPVEGVTAAVEKAIQPFAPDGVSLPRDSLEGAIAAAAAAAQGTILVILDQFEEYFLYHGDAAGDRLADELAACVNRDGLRANFLISIRQDAYARLGDLLGGRIANVYANFLHLEHLDEAGAREAIVKPLALLRRAGPEVVIEPELVDAVIEGVRIEDDEETSDGHSAPWAPGQARTRIETTYLQLVLQRLWDEELVRGSNVLRLSTLMDLGGAKEVIRTHLDRSLESFSDAEQTTIASAFRYLVTPAKTKIALTARDLAEWSGLAEAEIEQCLRRLARPEHKIVRPVLGESSDGPRYEIFHDALADPITGWRARWNRRNEEARHAERLDLERAAKEEAEQAASEASEREAAQRRLKRFALLGFAGAVALAAVALVFAVLAIHARRAEARQAKVAQSVQVARRSFQFAVRGTAFGPAAAALVNLEALDLAASEDALNGVLGPLQQNPGLPALAITDSSPYTVAFVNNSTLASGSSDGTVRLWDRSGHQIGEPLRTPGCDCAVSALASGAGGLLVVGRTSGSVDLWQASAPGQREPKLVRRLSMGSNVNVRAVALGTSGYLAAAGSDRSLRVWSVQDPSKPVLLGKRFDNQVITELAFDPDGLRLASTSDDGVNDTSNGAIRIWQIKDFLGSTPGGVVAQEAQGLGWSANGWFAYAVLDANNPRIEAVRIGQAAAFSVGELAERIRNPSKFGLRHVTVYLTAPAWSVALTGPDEHPVLIAGGPDWSVSTWDLRSGRPFGPPRMHAMRSVEDVAASPDGRTIASAGDDFVKIWPLVVKRPLATTVGSVSAGDSPKGGNEYAYDLALGPSGLAVAAGGQAGALLWDSRSAGSAGATAPIAQLESGAHVGAVAVAGDLLAVGVGSGLKLYRIGAGCRKPCALPRPVAGPHTKNISALAFDRRGRVIASGGDDGRVVLWRVSATGVVQPRPRVLATHAGSVNAVAFSPKADVLAEAGQDGELRLWDVADPSHPRPLGPTRSGFQGGSVWALAFSHDGKLLASGGQNKQVLVWEVSADGNVVKRPFSILQTNSIFALAFNHAGSLLAAGDADGSVCLYAVDKRDSMSGVGIGGSTCLQARHALGAARAEISAARFSRDDKSLFTAGSGNPIVRWSSLLWTQEPDRQTVAVLRADVCRLAGGRNLTADQWQEAFRDTQLADRYRKTCA